MAVRRNSLASIRYGMTIRLGVKRPVTEDGFAET